MRDPRRRNRNIGTSKAGHGADNRLTIPDRWSDLSIYWERLTSFVAVEKSANGLPITFLVEPPRTGYFHYCTVRDVLRVLELLPQQHVKHIKLVVFRQPTVKQTVLASVWGRLAYWSEIGRYKGPGVYLEAQPRDEILKRGKSLTPDARAELERLEKVGFRVERHSRGYHLHPTPGAVRASQLYRTIPHEIGHYVDYLECRRTFEWGDDEERFWDLYDAKPDRQKEVYAHRYADDFWRDMTASGRLPFEPLYDPEVLRADHLVPEWFAASTTAA
jgi:hypothetical protein